MKPPIKPKKPIKPAAPIEKSEISVGNLRCRVYNNEKYNISDIVRQFEIEINEKVDPLKIYLFTDFDQDDYSGDTYFGYSADKKKVVIDPNYKKKYEEYLVRLSKYETALAEYNQKLYMYEIASKEYNDFLKSEKIRKAKEVLAANGVKF